MSRVRSCLAILYELSSASLSNTGREVLLVGTFFALAVALAKMLAGVFRKVHEGGAAPGLPPIALVALVVNVAALAHYIGAPEWPGGSHSVSLPCGRFFDRLIRPSLEPEQRGITVKTNAYIAGVGMTSFGKFLDQGLKSIGAAAVEAAIMDAGIDRSKLQAAWVGNAAAGLVTGQESIRGQVVLRHASIGKIPVVNVENACGSASTAFNQAAIMVSAGAYDIVLALGVEKLYHEDKRKSFSAFTGAVDVEAMEEIMASLKKSAESGGAAQAASGAGEKRSMFMDIYAAGARRHMETYGTTAEQFAGVSAKNSFHGSMNERAQFREALSVEAVLASPMIAEPLTRPMCSPIGDGAAAAILVSEKAAKELNLQDPIRVLCSAMVSGWDHEPEATGAAATAATMAYDEAGLGPDDLSIVELHDASAPGEIFAYESLGLCSKGEGGKLISDGTTKLGGRLPVNTSGGLLRKGHPVGATGIAQIVELTEQLQGRAGKRQVEGARIGLAHNGGGSIGNDAAAMCITILGR